jgi:hypothetical protein
MNVNVFTHNPIVTSADYDGLTMMHASDPINCTPISLCYPNADQPKMDDRAALSRLYPVTVQNQASFPGKQLFFENTVRVHGTVHFSDTGGRPAQPMQGVNGAGRRLSQEHNGNGGSSERPGAGRLRKPGNRDSGRHRGWCAEHYSMRSCHRRSLDHGECRATTPVSGASVFFTSTPAISYAACGGAGSCTLLTDESGEASPQVTVLQAAVINISVLLAPASYKTPKSVQATNFEFGECCWRHERVLPTPPFTLLRSPATCR